MKKNITLLSTLLTFSFTFAQVGINTSAPSATLDVVSNVTDLTKPDGIMSPRVAKSDLISKTGAYSTPQMSAIVYVTDASATSTDNKFTNIDDVGYYYFDGTIWQKMKGSGGLAPVDKWDLNGNAITSGQFLGTTNTENLIFKYNNTEVGFLNDKNLKYGIGSLPQTTTGTNNVVLGNSALANNTNGNGNIAIGLSTLTNNTTGASNIAIGGNALSLNTTGGNSIAIGNNALSSNTASNNVAIGNSALSTNTVGNQNTAVGANALKSSISTNSNTAIGNNALTASTGASNTAVGSNTLSANTTGVSSTAIGRTAANVNTTGGYLVAVGDSAMKGNTTGNRNIAIGFNSLAISDTASDIVSVGAASFPMLKNAAGTDFNTALGNGAGKTIATGSNNTFIGSNTVGAAISNNSTVVGTGASIGLTNLNFATALGAYAIVTQSNSVILGRTNDSVGVGTTAPSNKLHVVATTNPLRVEGIQTASSPLPVLVIDANGIIYKSGSINAKTSSSSDIEELKQRITEQEEKIKNLTLKIEELLTNKQN